MRCEMSGSLHRSPFVLIWHFCVNPSRCCGALSSRQTPLGETWRSAPLYLHSLLPQWESKKIIAWGLVRGPCEHSSRENKQKAEGRLTGKNWWIEVESEVRAAYVRAIAPGFVKGDFFIAFLAVWKLGEGGGGGEELKSHKEEKRVCWFV